MAKLLDVLSLDRCPHCAVATPLLRKLGQHRTNNPAGSNDRWWFIYACSSCGGVVAASARRPQDEAIQVIPEAATVSDDIPERPRGYLAQAFSSVHAPAGAVMLAASAVDSMLKIKEYTDGSLYERINKAAEDNVITDDMAKWAHDVRLDANDQRHADEGAALPSEEDAKRVIDFAKGLAEVLFVLPARVRRGIRDAQDNE